MKGARSEWEARNGAGRGVADEIKLEPCNYSDGSSKSDLFRGFCELFDRASGADLNLYFFFFWLVGLVYPCGKMVWYRMI